MLYFFISKMLGVDYSLPVSTPTFIIEPSFFVGKYGIRRAEALSPAPFPEVRTRAIHGAPGFTPALCLYSLSSASTLRRSKSAAVPDSPPQLPVDG